MHGHDNDDDDDDDPSDPSMSLATVRSHIEGVLQFLDQGPRDISNSNQLYPMMREALSDIIEKQLSCTKQTSISLFFRPRTPSSTQSSCPSSSLDVTPETPSTSSGSTTLLPSTASSSLPTYDLDSEDEGAMDDPSF